MSNDFKSILNRLLEQVDDTLDKRQGSIIYDALAPAAMELAQCYTELEIYKEQTYLGSATGENLDNRVADYGLTRNDATNAIRIITTYNTDEELYDVPIGTRFSIPEDYGGYNYTITEKIETGRFKAECETPGTVGNEYLGVLLPLYNVANLGSAQITGTFEAGEDVEDDEHLRKRALNKLNKDAFGGNQADYQRYLETIDGVGQAKVFPIWNGGGTVKISFVNSDNTIPSTEFVNEVQTLIDPIQNSGEGLGLAPIGHSVTVVAPTLKNINITATIELDSDYQLENVEPEIEEKLEEYIDEVQNNWQIYSSLTIFISRVIANILSVTGVINVSRVLINNEAADLILAENSSIQEFPVLGEVVINV